MRNFIFLTQEGLTKTPSDTDIENLQVLGTANGENENQAFENLIKENDFLLYSDYDEVMCLELRGEEVNYFSLKDLQK
jgi:hypothetical protein